MEPKSIFDAPEEAKEVVQPQEEQPEPVNESDNESLKVAETRTSPTLSDNIRVLREKIEQDAKEMARIKAENERLRTSPQKASTETDRMRNLETQLVETRLKTEFPDFKKVVNADNIAVLQAKHPELIPAITITADKDIYSTAAAAYTLIKKLGIAPDDVYVEDKAIAQKNVNKPKPLSSLTPQAGDSPLAHANAFSSSLTQERKTQIWRQMQEDMRNG